MSPPVYLPMLAESGAGRVKGEWAAEPLDARRLHAGLRIVSASKSVRRVIEITSTTYLFGDTDETG